MALMGVCPQVTICFAIIATLCSLHLPNVLTTVPEHDSLEAGEDELENIYGLPGVHFEYRFEVGAGRIQCFYQKLRQDSQLQVTFEVLRGADKNINMDIRTQSGSVVEKFEWINEGNIDTVVNETGEYSFCFENGMSLYSSKVVYFFLLSYVYADWSNYAEEIRGFHEEVENVTQILSTVNENTNKMLKMASVSRGHMLNDWYTIRTNNRNVQLWSIVLCVIIVATSVFQVYFVRRMFNVHGASASKPRA